MTAAPGSGGAAQPGPLGRPGHLLGEQRAHGNPGRHAHPAEHLRERRGCARHGAEPGRGPPASSSPKQYAGRLLPADPPPRAEVSAAAAPSSTRRGCRPAGSRGGRERDPRDGQSPPAFGRRCPASGAPTPAAPARRRAGPARRRAGVAPPSEQLVGPHLQGERVVDRVRRAPVIDHVGGGLDHGSLEQHQGGGAASGCSARPGRSAPSREGVEQPAARRGARRASSSVVDQAIVSTGTGTVLYEP